MSSTAPTVTVTHIVLTKDVYNELLSALDTEEEEYGKTAESANARRWLHYRWLIEQSGQGEDK
jgi:hypothetical protein